MYPIDKVMSLFLDSKVKISQKNELPSSITLLLLRNSEEKKVDSTLYEKQCTPLIQYLGSIRTPSGTNATPLNDAKLIVTNPKYVWESNVDALVKAYLSLSDSDLMNITPPPGLVYEHLEAQIKAITERLKEPFSFTLAENRDEKSVKSAFFSLVLALKQLNRENSESYPEIELKKSKLTSDEVSLLFELLNEQKVFYLSLDLSENSISDKAKSSIELYMTNPECLMTLTLKNNQVTETIKSSPLSTLIIN